MDEHHRFAMLAKQLIFRAQEAAEALPRSPFAVSQRGRLADIRAALEDLDNEATDEMIARGRRPAEAVSGTGRTPV